jgi:polysaccharide biosynthesis protein PslG
VDLTHYNWGNGPSNHAQSYGVLRGTDYSPKPSYYAYQSLCSMFDAQTERDQRLKMGVDGASDRQIATAGFVRNGRGLYSYWLATDLLDAFAPKTVSLQLPMPGNATIERPILIDPLSQRVYNLKVAESKAGAITLAGLPLFNYPLMITDLAAVQISH